MVVSMSVAAVAAEAAEAAASSDWYVWRRRCGQEPWGGHAGQSSSRRSRSRLEGPSSKGEANLFHLAEQRPE